MKSTLALLILGLYSAASASLVPQNTGLVPQSVASLDIDKDGDLDLVVCHAFDDRVVVLEQDSSGDFQPGQSILVGVSPLHPANAPRFLVAEDVNQDGLTDLLVLCSGNFSFGVPPSVQTLLNAGGALVPMPASDVVPDITSDRFPVHFAQGDFAGDAYRDLAVAQLRDESIRILSGDGTGSFSIGPRLPVAIGLNDPHYVLKWDIDHNDFDDLLAICSNGVSVHLQTSSGVFDPAITLDLQTTGIDLRSGWIDDVTADGKADLILADSNSRVIIYSTISGYATSSSELVYSDPGLAGCSDVRTTLWDSDWLPDIIVSNQDNATVSLIQDDGTYSVLPTGNQPRRIALADLDADGRRDILTANQGDQGDPLNPDVTIHLHGENVGTAAIPSLNMVEYLGNSAGPLISNAIDISLPTSQRLWILGPDGLSITRINPSPNLNANPASRIEDTYILPAPAAGMVFTGPVAGYFLEDGFPAIHQFSTAGPATSTIPLAITPGALGLRGIAWDGSNNEFYLSDPSNKLIYRVDETGSIITSFSTNYPITSLTWNEAADRLYATATGRSDVLVFERSGLPDNLRAFDLASKVPAFNGVGILALSISGSLGEIYIATSNGLLTHIDDAGDFTSAISISPGSNPLGAAYDSPNTNLFVLGSDYHVLKVRYPNVGNAKLISLWQLIEANPSFEPAGIAWDGTSETLLIAGHGETSVAEVDLDGIFLGYRDTSALPIGPRYCGGVAVDPASTLYLRDIFGVYTASVPNGLYVGAGSRCAISEISGELTAWLTEPGLMLNLDLLTEERSLFNVPPTISSFVPVQGTGAIIYRDTDQSIATIPGEPWNETRVRGWLDF